MHVAEEFEIAAPSLASMATFLAMAATRESAGADTLTDFRQPVNF